MFKNTCFNTIIRYCPLQRGQKRVSRSSFTGRLRIIQRLMSKGKFSLSVGSKETRFYNINLDVDPSVNPDIVADARFLPFRDRCFQQVLFTDVIEHLPKGSDLKALQEFIESSSLGESLS